MSVGRQRVLRAAFLLASLAATVSLVDSGAGRGGPTRPLKKPKAAATVPAPGELTSWKEIDRLVSEQKFEEAAKRVAERRFAAQKARDEAEWTKALIREVQLRTGLHGYETAVRFLKEEKWPEGLLSRSALNLFYAHSLVHYARAYSWEIAKREKVESKAPLDLKAWTREQIFSEARRAYLEVWDKREALGSFEVGRLLEYLEPNTYPKQVRGTLRDTVSYLFVELLADTSGWTPEQLNELFQLNLLALLRQGGQTSPLRLEDPVVHPLEKIVAVLEDLEAWQAGDGRREAALEARLERLRRLHASFSEEKDRAAIRRGLEDRLARERDLPWWSMGMATLAEFLEAQEVPDNLASARAAAQEGAKAYPDSIGGKRCLSIVQTISAPDYQVASMMSDGLERRSIEMTHKNLPALYLRAYAVDLESRIEKAKDYSLLPAGPELREILRSASPVHEWTVRLPATPDFKPHRTFVTPPFVTTGLYLVAASARKDFDEQSNRIEAVNLIITDLVLVTRLEESAVEVKALSGGTGQPVVGADISLFEFDWNTKHRRLETKKSDANGIARFDYRPDRENKFFFALGKMGKDLALDANYLTFSKAREPEETTQSLLYTDRSIYRPLQRIDWKVLLFRGRRDLGRFKTASGTPVTVSLIDANNQKVDAKTVSTNDFGSASGEFQIPAGRALGNWRLESSLNGAVYFGVEEYKRPTFEVAWKDPEAPLRLNRPATLTGSARYYFGLPVVNGTVRWRVVRTPEFPWWWEWSGRRTFARAQTIALGTASLKPDGTFQVTFTPAADERIGDRAKEVTYRYTASVDVMDEGGETRSDTRSFRLGLVAVEAHARMETAFFRQGVPTEMTLTRTDLDGLPRAGSGSWRLFELRQPETTLLPAERPIAEHRNSERFETPGDRLRPRWETRESLEGVLRDWPDGKEKSRGLLTHDAKGEARVVFPDLPPGAWRLHYETTDDFGAKYEMSKEFLVAGKKAPVKLPAVLLAESSSVPVGNTVRLLALSGWADQTLFLEIFRDGKLVQRKTLTGAENSLIEIPVGENDRGGFGVRLSALRDHQFLDLTQSVFVPWDDRRLKVEFATFRDKIRPKSRETWRVTVKAPKGASSEERAAELLAYMYDRSLDTFRAHSPADPLSLYPNRAAVAPLHASLGESYPQWVSDRDFARVRPEGLLLPDRLKFFESYGIGGPGRGDFASKRAILADAMATRGEIAVAAEAPAAVSLTGALIGEREEKEARNSAVAPPPLAAVALRSDFSETAFWRPHLLTDAGGAAAIEFTVPDSVTSWNVWVHAVTRDLKAGSVKKEARSVKELMVRPYVPRFLREGDRAEVKVVVNNASQRLMSGRVVFDILNTDANESVLSEFGLARDAAHPFTVAAGGGTNVTFSVVAPKKVGSYGFRVTAVSGDTSDGELRPVPVLPGRVHLVQSRFVTLHDKDRRTMEFGDLRKEDDPSRINEQMVVTVDAQLFYSVLQALPYLVNYPYECTEQILNRFVSTGIVSSLYRDYPAVAKMAEEFSKRETLLETWDSADPNRKMALEEAPWLEVSKGGKEAGFGLANVLDPRIAKAEREASLAKLAKAQTAIGGFPWWPGGPPSPYMTLYLAYGFAKASEFGVEVPKEMVQRGWQYLARHFREEYAKRMIADDCRWEFLTFLNYVATCYPDASWTGDALKPEERQAILAFSFKHWKEHTPYSKEYLALTLKRMGRPTDARLVWASVMDSSKTDRDLGTYWAREDRSWLWYNDTIETHAFALRTLLELDPSDPRREGLVEWLLLNKKLNQWKSTRATAEVIYALVHYLKKEGALALREDATVTVGPQKVTFTFEPDRYTGKKNQVVIPGEKVDPNASSAVIVEKESPGLAFASAMWHFSTERLPEEDRGDFFRVSRKYFKRESGPGGFGLKPLSEGATLQPGDQVEVQISLRSKHAAEYVHLRDPRAAGLEPENAVSRHKWDLGIVWYEETRDSGSNFFFEQLPAGDYTFKYRLRANMAGTFKVGPATVQSMYAPEFAAFSSGGTVTIAPVP